MKKILLLLMVLYGCAIDKPAYVLLGQSNACQELAAGMQADVRVLQYNHGGQPIEQWATEAGKTKAGQDLSYLYNNLKGYYLEAVFWFQGEQNCYDINTQDNYYQYTCNWFDILRSVYPVDINIIQIGYAGTEQEVLDNYDFIRAEQVRLNDTYSGVIIDSANYDRVDNWHLTDDGYLQLGKDIIKLYEGTL